VGGGGVALVLGEAVARVGGVQRDHAAVPRDLGEDRGSGDAVAPLVSLHEGPLRERGADGDAAVDRDEGRASVRCRGALEGLGEGALHGPEGGLEDVDPVDLVVLHAGSHDGAGKRTTACLVQSRDDGDAPGPGPALDVAKAATGG